MSLRDRYEEAVRGLRARVDAMRRDGHPPEAIARDVHAERRRLAVHYKGLTPEPHRTLIEERTVRVYGNPQGPTIDFLRAQGKSWEAIIDGATRPGPPIGPIPGPEDGRT
ncbi:cell wall-binding protein [Methylobacterium tarhaniae]|uniref:Cell wall-binding protein n=1 Tax=Methylobacterium tarhaniae TaxID=1187852 RepID=A0A0J6SAJ4_9HYPH|nr:hypothetical protein [Methylobacterium tarhaniae]KMO30747.1 cell wall-binding protein [Methylobacterium tarhaniae]